MCASEFSTSFPCFSVDGVDLSLELDFGDIQLTAELPKEHCLTVLKYTFRVNVLKSISSKYDREYCFDVMPG